VPGPHKGEAFSKVFKLGPDEVANLKLLELQAGFFDIERTVISSQCNIHPDLGLLSVSFSSFWRIVAFRLRRTHHESAKVRKHEKERKILCFQVLVFS